MILFIIRNICLCLLFRLKIYTLLNVISKYTLWSSIYGMFTIQTTNSKDLSTSPLTHLNLINIPKYKILNHNLPWRPQSILLRYRCPSFSLPWDLETRGNRLYLGGKFFQNLLFDYTKDFFSHTTWPYYFHTIFFSILKKLHTKLIHYLKIKHNLSNVPFPSASTSLIISWSSASVGFWPGLFLQMLGIPNIQDLFLLI